MGLLDTIKSVLGLSSDDESADRDGTDVAVEYEPETESEATVKGVDEGAAASSGDAAASTGSMTEEPPEEGVRGAAEPAEAAGPQTDDVDAGPTDELDEGDEDEEAAAATGSTTEESVGGGTEPAEADETPDATEQADEEAAASGGDAAASTGSMTEEPPEEGVRGAAEPAEAAGPQTDDVDAGPSDELDEDGEDGDEGVADADDETDDRPVDTLAGIGPAYAERLNDADIETAGDLTSADPLTVAEESGISEKRIERWMETARETR